MIMIIIGDQASPVVQIVGTAVQHVEDSSLRHHLLHVLRGLAPDEATAPPPSALPQSEGKAHNSTAASSQK